MSTTDEIKQNLAKSTAIVFIFDVTSSMSPCLNDVRRKLRDLVEMMMGDIPGLKIGVIAHGDYCDGGWNGYTKDYPNESGFIDILDLTDDIGKVMNFINATPGRSGGDMPECYGFALYKAKSLSWPESGGSVVIIGDATPHETPDAPAGTNPYNLDWRKEIRDLNEKNIMVFPVQCLMVPTAVDTNRFWEDISGESKTPMLILDNFNESAATMAAIAYASAGENAYKEYMDKSVAVCSVGFAANTEKLRAYVEGRDSID